MKNKSIINNPDHTPQNNYVVGIGASAGGLEAINELFDNMPVSTGFSFVIIQHLSPEHKSLMNELLAKHTEMQVYEAQERMAIRPNCIYLIPPGKIITLKNGMLKLVEKIRDHQPNNAIDLFFDSLAKEKAEKAIAIILSGTGTDGTKGIQAIKNSGGTVIVQDPTTAQFDGMPNSAVSTGYVDLILAPEMMPEELLEFIEEAPLLRSFNTLTNQEEATRMDILELVYKTTSHDFSNYKRPTINRRLGKRMAEKNIRSLVDYYNYLVGNPEEVKKLCKEFLLHVTRFFRDEEAFNTLRTVVIPDILKKRVKGEVIKAWTVACSTREEAYSIAMLFDECIEALKEHDIDVKIFASDISQDVIEIASRGIYSEDNVKNISPERLKKYFIKESNGYRVIPTIRKMIVFARHDISKDPPFSKIDLLSCRNMLIYMTPILQKSILQKFHFAINDNGYLFMGASENIGVLKDVMQEVDKKWKIYKCSSKIRVADLEAFSNPADKNAHHNLIVAAKSKNALNNLAEIFKETLLEEYDYAGIFIDRDFEVKQAIGNFKKFLDFPEGTFNFNLLKLVPTDLSIALSSGIRRAVNDNERVVQKNILIQTGKEERRVTAIIKPFLVQKAYLQPFLFIVLKEEDLIKKRHGSTAVTPQEFTTERISELEIELRDTKENLQALIEEVESANEELQSSNEEIISSNEELQSTNEELQSLNEELHTVNAEHQLKIKELIELNDDLNNYFRNTDIGQVLIDKKMIIRKFSPGATRQVNLIATDIGRSIVDISTNIKNQNFINDIKTVIQTSRTLEKEISTEDESVYLMRIVPYMKQNKSVDGVVINFIDVSEVKKLNNILEAVLNSSTSGIMALKALRNEKHRIIDFSFISANKASQLLLGLDDDITTLTFKDVYGHVDPEIFDRYKEVTETGNTSKFEFYDERTGLWYETVAAKMMDGLVVTFNDVTEKKSASELIEKGYQDLKQTSDELQDTNVKLEQSNMDLLQFASVASHDLKEPLRKIQVFGNLLKERIENKIDGGDSNYLEKITNSSNRMQVLIDDILTLSRLSKTDTRHDKVDLNKTVEQILEDLEISIRDKKAKIKLTKLPTVSGVPGQMHQLFQNIISNAIKFNQAEPVISIKEEKITKKLAEEYKIKVSEYYCICIEDNGIGFDEKFSEKIFGIFQRLEKTNYQGTGIGLAIVKKIIDNHKGFVKATSKEGEGSTFRIILPK
ncbi:chemotaxis protein CheB [Flavipsychrobacter stenotrophus]|nr:chemotaxis protein CheB [Flavipsychrobacter stenotrophus]